VSARRKEATSESQVYLDRDIAGSILVVAKGKVAALDQDGKLIGTFATDRLAMAAVIAAARSGRSAA
jgi:hypothetical protein